MEISINFPPMAIDGDVNCFFYAEPIKVDPNIVCRIPGYLATLSTSSNRFSHERTQHPTTSYSCLSCGLYAKNKITIDNHNDDAVNIILTVVFFGGDSQDLEQSQGGICRRGRSSPSRLKRKIIFDFDLIFLFVVG
jgi:hypothetical protein